MSEETPDRRTKVEVRQITEWAWRLVVAVLIPLLYNLNNSITSIEKEMTVVRQDLVRVSASSFDAADGLQVWREITRLSAEVEQVQVDVRKIEEARIREHKDGF